MDRRHPPPRGTAVRPLVASAQIVGLGVAAHVGAGAAAPPAGHLLASAAVVTAACFALHHRLVRWPVAALLATVAQLFVHTAASAAAAGATAPAAHAAHLDAASTSAPGARMLLAHAVAAAVTALVLLWQDRIVLAVVRALSPSFACCPLVLAGQRWDGRAGPRPLRSLRVLDVSPRRGPPADPASAVP